MDRVVPMIFVVGCPRSGTYLLSAILNGSGQVAIPTETHFIPHFWRFRRFAGNLEKPAARGRILRAIFIFLRIWLMRSEQERNFRAVTRHSLLIVEKQIEKIVRKTKTFPEIVNQIFFSYAKIKEASLCGDKSAFYDVIPLDEIDKASGGMGRFIHVIRDGRDVCVSWQKIKVGPETLGEAAAAWAQHVSTKRSWGLRNPNRYFELRYEDLVKYPEKTLRRVCAFLNITYKKSLLGFHKKVYARDISNSSTHSQLSRPLNSGNREKWKRELTHAEIKNIETIAGEMLGIAGYKLGVLKPPFKKNISGTTTSLSIRRVRLTLKNFLPLFAIGASWINFPLDRLCNSMIWLAVETWICRKFHNE